MRTDFSDGLWPRLIADIGGTNARFALETAPQHFEQVQVLACKDYAGIVDAVAEYLVRIGRASRVSTRPPLGTVAPPEPG